MALWRKDCVDHEGGAQDRPLRILAEHQAQEDEVAVPRLGDEADRLVVVDRRQVLHGLAGGVLDLAQLALGLREASVCHARHRT
jgi:hypothetical protein